MPGTPDGAKATHRVTVGSEDEIGRVGIVTAEVVHEPCGCILNLGLRGTAWDRGRIYPRSCKLARGVGNMRATTTTIRRADRDALTILSVNVIPGTTSNVAEEACDVGLGLGAGIAAC